MLIKAVDNQNNIFVPTFHTKVSHQFFFTQIEKSLGSGGKKVGSGHQNQTYFFFSPYYNPSIKCVLYDKEYSNLVQSNSPKATHSPKSTALADGTAA